MYMDGIYLRRNWGGEYENVSVLIATAVNEEGYREILGAEEGMKEDKASWSNFFQWLKDRGLDGVQLIVGDKCLAMLEAMVYFYRNVFSCVPRNKGKLVAKMLKAIHAQESRAAAQAKARDMVAALCEMKLHKAAKKVEDGLEETLAYTAFPYEHWTRIRTNNVIERLFNRHGGKFCVNADWAQAKTRGKSRRIAQQIRGESAVLGLVSDENGDMRGAAVNAAALVREC